MEERTIDRTALSSAFEELSREISRAGEKSAEIRLFGGTAMMLQFSERGATLDVDCVVTRGHGAVMRAMPIVARRLGLPSGWLNEGVSVYRIRHETDGDFAEMFALPSRRPRAAHSRRPSKVSDGDEDFRARPWCRARQV